MANNKIILLLFLVCFLFTTNLSATEEYAETTGRDCHSCHVDPSGGGELTPEGDGFAYSLGAAEGEATLPQRTDASHWFRLLVGYLHILFGFFWFGTILYVHLILKPAYASRGLPRGEVKLGLASMVIMAVTGAILFAYRVPSFEMLVSTKFGILLLLKIGLFLIMVGSALFVVLFLGPRLQRKRAAAVVAEAGKLSLEKLAGYDGKEGRRAYLAYQGDIYDATASPLWKNGSHVRRHEAGLDLTEELSAAPHGEEMLLRLPKVGTLRSAEGAPGLTPPPQLFYIMAYMNLGFVLLIVLILACWRWL